MNNPRIHGCAPFTLAVIHGGPGAPGEMMPVARELAKTRGVIEPFQTATTVDGQVQELIKIVGEFADPPVTLIGYSWGAILAFVLAAQEPALVKKLILISSGPFEEQYAAGIMETRLHRLSDTEKVSAAFLLQIINDPGAHDKDQAFRDLGHLMSKADSYDPVFSAKNYGEYQCNIHRKVWDEAHVLRESGSLIALGRNILCPVIAIHGDYDPHPADGVKIPLTRVINNFKFYLLKDCGHKPWLEKSARDRFYQILRQELHYQ